MRTCPLCGESCSALSGNGACPRCERRIQTHLVPHVHQLAEAMDLAATADDEDTKRRQLELILETAGELRDYERAGIPTCAPVPSELLKRYSAELDALGPEAVEERVTFCSGCGEMLAWGTRPCPHCHGDPDPEPAAP